MTIRSSTILMLLVILSFLDIELSINCKKIARNRVRILQIETLSDNHEEALQELEQKFKSTLNVVELNDGSIQNNRETTYHIFDYENMNVTMQSYSEVEGKWREFTYKMKSFYKENQWDYVIVCDDRVMKEIWFSPEFNHLGYDLHNGSRMTFHELEQLK